MKKNFLFWSDSYKLSTSNDINTHCYDIKKLTYFSFSINSCYAIFDKYILTWIPRTQNIYFDSYEFLKNEPIEFNNLGTKKILKIICNNNVIHSISDDGQVFSWGNDRDKYGTLGLGFNYNQQAPILNTNFSNKRIIDISISEKHCAALDVNRQVYTWGTGFNGELGLENTEVTNIPIPIEIGKKFIDKVKCGNNYTCLVDYNRNCIYFGSIYNEINNIKKYITIENIYVSDIFCGESVLAIIDMYGDLYLYNDIEFLYKVKIDMKIKNMKFTGKNFYAVSLDGNYILEFIQKKGKFSLNNYVENIYGIDNENITKFNLIDTPYFNNLIFYLIEIKNKDLIIKKKKNIFFPVKINRHDDSRFDKSYASQGFFDSDKKSKFTYSYRDNPDESNVYPANFKTNPSVFNDTQGIIESKRIGRINNMLGQIFEKKFNIIDNRRKSQEPCKQINYIQLERMNEKYDDNMRSFSNKGESSFKSQINLLDTNDDNYGKIDQNNEIINIANMTISSNKKIHNLNIANQNYSVISPIRIDNICDISNGKAGQLFFNQIENKITNNEDFSCINDKVKCDLVENNVATYSYNPHKEKDTSNGSDENEEIKISYKKKLESPEHKFERSYSRPKSNGFKIKKIEKIAQDMNGTIRNTDHESSKADESIPITNFSNLENEKYKTPEKPDCNPFKKANTNQSRNSKSKDMDQLYSEYKKDINIKNEEFSKNSFYVSINSCDNSMLVKTLPDDRKICLNEDISHVPLPKPYIKPISKKKDSSRKTEICIGKPDKLYNDLMKENDYNINKNIEIETIPYAIYKSSLTFNSDDELNNCLRCEDNLETNINDIMKNKPHISNREINMEIISNNFKNIEEKKIKRQDSANINRIENIEILKAKSMKNFHTPNMQKSKSLSKFTNARIQSNKIIEKVKQTNKKIDKGEVKVLKRENMSQIRLNSVRNKDIILSNKNTKCETNCLSSRDNLIKIVDDNIDSQRSSHSISDCKAPEKSVLSTNSNQKNNKLDLTNNIIRKIKNQTKPNTPDIYKNYLKSKSPKEKNYTTISSASKLSKQNSKSIFNKASEKKVVKNCSSNPNFKKNIQTANVQTVNPNIMQENYILSEIEKREQIVEKAENIKRIPIKSRVIKSPKKNKTANCSLEKPYTIRTNNYPKYTKKEVDYSIESKETNNEYNKLFIESRKDFHRMYDNDKFADSFKDEAFSVNYSNTTENIRDKIINNLENFKLEKVKQKLEDNINKINTIVNLSPQDKIYRPDMISEDVERCSIYEPIELDRSQITTLMNVSYRKSLNNWDQIGKKESSQSLMKVELNSDNNVFNELSDNKKEYLNSTAKKITIVDILMREKLKKSDSKK